MLIVILAILFLGGLAWMIVRPFLRVRPREWKVPAGRKAPEVLARRFGSTAGVLTSLLLVSLASTVWVAPASAGGTMTITEPTYHTATSSTSTVNYRSFTNGIAAYSTTEGEVQNVAGGSGAWTFSSITITLATAPDNGAGTQKYTYTFRDNETDIASVDISEASKVGTIAGPITVQPGDRFDWKVTPSGTPASTGDSQQSVVITGPGQLWTCPSTTSHLEIAGSTNYLAYHIRGNQTIEINEELPVACAGTVSCMYMDLQTAPGGADSVTMTFRKGTAGAMSDTALTCACSGATKANHDTTHTVHLNAGDVIEIKFVITGTSASTRTRYGCQFSPDVLGNTSEPFEGGTLQGGSPIFVAGETANATTETKLLTWPACLITAVYDCTVSTPGAAAQTLTVLCRQNSGNTSLTDIVTGTATTSNASFTVVVAANDTIGWKITSGAGSTSPLLTKSSCCVFFWQAINARRAPDHPRAGTRGAMLMRRTPVRRVRSFDWDLGELNSLYGEALCAH